MTRYLFTEDEESLVETKATRGESLVRLAYRLSQPVSSDANTSSAEIIQFVLILAFPSLVLSFHCCHVPSGT
jgi:hypothetical protein